MSIVLFFENPDSHPLHATFCLVYPVKAYLLLCKTSHARRYVSEGDIIAIPSAPFSPVVEVLTGHGGQFKAQPEAHTVLIKVHIVSRQVNTIIIRNSTGEGAEAATGQLQQTGSRPLPMLVDIASTRVTMKVSKKRR